jgi:hypothetical protein
MPSTFRLLASASNGREIHKTPDPGSLPCAESERAASGIPSAALVLLSTMAASRESRTEMAFNFPISGHK